MNPVHVEHPPAAGPARPEDALLMLVDDEPLNVEMIRGHLEDAGYTRFVTTSDSREALALARRHLPDAVLLDLSMPGVDGITVLAGLRAESDLAHVPVLMVTASTEHAAKLRALELGATDFLSKPVDPVELVLRVKNTLAAKAHLERLALTDMATGLPNRTAFARRLQAETDAAVRNGTCAAVIHLMVTGLGEANEAFGPEEGVAILRTVADRLGATLRSSDVVGHATDGPATVARHASDEFLVLLPRVRSPEDAGTVAQRLQQVIAAPVLVSDNQLTLASNAGVAVLPRDGVEAGDLLEGAASAMRQAWRSGRGELRYYSTELNEQSRRRVQRTGELRRAIEGDELVLHYQPKCDVPSGAWVGAEALVRWQHPRDGLVGPSEFVPLAEQSGLIAALGSWVLQAAARQLRSWADAGVCPPRISVNVSPDQLQAGTLLAEVDRLVGAWPPTAEHLCLELTEGVLLDRSPETLAQLHGLRARGIRLSIDDFGTGYSSLAYLHELPFDELKIDRSFIGRLETNGTIVQAIVAMAHALGLRVVAEGVEDAAQLRRLAALSCDEYQGYLVSRALPADVFTEKLLASRAERAGFTAPVLLPE